ncbi:MAG: hypothetical protein ACRCZO_16985 [Cetobacterium sp.]
MMVFKNKDNRESVKNFSLEELVPKDHLIRKIIVLLIFLLLEIKLSIYIIIEELIVLILLFYLK